MFTQYLQGITKKIPQEFRFAVASTLLIGVAVHLFMLTNMLITGDDLALLNVNNQTLYGRWFTFFPAAISGEYNILLSCLFGIFYISISVGLLCIVFNLHSKSAIILLGAIMVSFPTIATTLVYINSSDAYCFALLLNAIAAVFITKGSHQCYYFLGGILLILGLATYQAYFPFIVAIMVIYYLKKLLFSAENFVSILKSGIITISVFVFSILIYLVITKNSELFFGTALSSAHGISTMGETSVSSLAHGIKTAYREFLGCFFFDSQRIHFSLLSRFAIFLIFVGTMILFTWKLLRLTKAKRFLNAIASILLLCLIPLAGGLIYLMGAGYTHMLMYYGFVAFFLLPIVIYEEVDCSSREYWCKWKIAVLGIMLVSLIIMSLHYSILDNEAYFNSYYINKQTFAFSERVATRLEADPNYSVDKTVVVLGQPFLENLYPINQRNQMLEMTGLNGYFVRIEDRMGQYLNSYIGMPNNIITAKEVSRLPLTEDEIDIVVKSPTYPQAGSIQTFGDIMVIKLEELGKLAGFDYRDIAIKPNGKRLLFVNEFSEVPIQCAWYVYLFDERIYASEYSDDNTLDFEFLQKGNYKVVAFVRTKENSSEGKWLCAAKVKVKANGDITFTLGEE